MSSSPRWCRSAPSTPRGSCRTTPTATPTTTSTQPPSKSCPSARYAAFANLSIYTCQFKICLLLRQDNVVCLPAKLAQSLGGMGRIATVHKVNSLVHLIDPNTGQCMYAETLDPYTQQGLYGLRLKGTYQNGLSISRIEHSMERQSCNVSSDAAKPGLEIPKRVSSEWRPHSFGLFLSRFCSI